MREEATSNQIRVEDCRVEDDVVRVPHPFRRGTFVTFDINGGMKEMDEFKLIPRPTREDMKRLKITLDLVTDTETQLRTQASGSEVTVQLIKDNMDLYPSAYRRCRDVAYDAYLASRRKD